MNNSGELIWKGQTVGKATIITVDMWYVNATWTPDQSEGAREFGHMASQLKAEEVIKNFEKGIIVELKYSNSSSKREKFLVLRLEGSNLYLRMVSNEVADRVDRKLLEPWQETDDPAFYENELNKEVSFFHPLNWKKIRAIGIRTDRDDVLFEIVSGKPKYAVVHLTWQKETSRKFPSTKFYKDWTDVYENCILMDHKDWKEERV